MEKQRGGTGFKVKQKRQGDWERASRVLGRQAEKLKASQQYEKDSFGKEWSSMFNDAKSSRGYGSREESVGSSGIGILMT